MFFYLFHSHKYVADENLFEIDTTLQYERIYSTAISIDVI